MFGIFGQKKTNPELEAVRRHVQGVQKQFDALGTAMQKSIEQATADNPVLAEMVHDSKRAIKGLDSENAEIRYWALAILNSHHMTVTSHLSQLEKMTTSEPNVEIRGGAMLSLSSIAAFDLPQGKKQSIGRQFAKIALQESEPLEIRKAAYRALCRLDKDGPRFFKSFDDLAFPEEVEWEFVSSWK